MKIAIECSYNWCGTDIVELPEGKNSQDIKDIFVKYGRATITFNDDSMKEYVLSDLDVDSVDWKYPTTTKAYDTDNEGVPNHELIFWYE